VFPEVNAPTNGPVEFSTFNEPEIRRPSAFPVLSSGSRLTVGGEIA
jgi:hypothetical protein